MLVSMLHFRRCSPHVITVFDVLYGDAHMYIAGINATSQEVFSRTRRVIINLAQIKRYCVLFL